MSMETVLIILVAVENRDVVARTKPQRSPDQGDPSPCQEVTCVLNVREVFQLKGHVVHACHAASQEVHGMMIRAAPHEDEEVVDPVRDFESEQLLVEGRDRFRIGREEGHMSQLQWADSDRLHAVTGAAGVAENFNQGLVWITKQQQL